MTISAAPGQKVALKFPLNQTDALSVTVDWSAWLEGDTISSVVWTPDPDITVTNESNTMTTVTAILTAGSDTGRKRVQVQITTAQSQKRSLAIDATVVDLI